MIVACETHSIEGTMAEAESTAAFNLVVEGERPGDQIRIPFDQLIP
jgi:hypothetical protein